MEIINFINGKGKLASEPILKEFVEKYPTQNKGILGSDAIAFVKRFNKDCALVEDNNYLIKTTGALFYVINGCHMFYIYRAGDVIEKWDPSTWQHTINNCTLYAALVAIIRPLTSFEKTKELIRKISDKPNTESCNKLAEISQHFFNRGLSYFIYPSLPTMNTAFKPKRNKRVKVSNSRNSH